LSRNLKSEEDIEFEVVETEELTHEEIDVISHCLARLIWHHIKNENPYSTCSHKDETGFEGKVYKK
jgi:hypothetical protein